MKGFLKFLILVALLVPAWIAFLSMSGDDKMKQSANAGPLVAVEQALQEAKDGSWVSGVTRMDPMPSAKAWTVAGLTAASVDAELVSTEPFAATLHSTCLPLSDAACWVVDRLDVSPGNPSAPAAEAGSQDDADAERLLIVQEQLRNLDLDPGPSDGVFGRQTEEAIQAYIAQAGNSETDDPTAQALIELEVMGRLARGTRHHAQGDYHAALQDYADVLALDPDNARARFNRGLAYQEMSVPDLAIREYDAALDREDDYAMAYHSRGNAHFDTGGYWRGFADHADGLGVRYLGEQYLVVTERVGDAWTKVEPQVVEMLQWAEGAWDQAKETLAEKLQSAKTGSEEEAT